MLIITLGDPWSVTQECLMRLWPMWSPGAGQSSVLVGSLSQWKIQAQARQWGVPSWRVISDWKELGGPGLYFLNIDGDERPVLASELSELERGQIATRSLEVLRTLPAPRSKLAVLTAPIDKKVCQLAGFSYPGQTEFFMDLWGAEGVMILAGPRLRVALASNHLALRDVVPALSTDLIVRKLILLETSLQTIFGLAKPRIAVAAVNPHVGDRGLFGDEDSRIVAPAVQTLQAQGMNVSGPWPADTVFFRCYEGEFDAVLAMYHDQGLAPLKTVHFYDAVNVTGGLPSLRLSPDHGPASELFGRGKARDDSFRIAIELARKYQGTKSAGG